jgi:hypothetical protein
MMAITLRLLRHACPLALFLLLAALPAAAQVTTEVLARAPKDAHVSIGPQGKFIAWYVPVGEGADIYINGKLESHADRLPWGNIPFTYHYDGTRYAYLIEQGDQTVAMVDGKKVWSEETNPESSIELPFAGKHWVLHAMNGATIIDGVEWKLALEPDFDITSTGESVTMVVRQTDNRMHILRDGKEVAVADAVNWSWFLGDGRLAWVASVAPKKIGVPGVHALFIDGVQIMPLTEDEEIMQMTYFDAHYLMVISSISTAQGSSTLLVDGVRSRQYPGSFSDINISIDGSHLAVLDKVEGGKKVQRVIYNHMVGPAFATVTRPDFSPSGTHCAYVGRRADGARVLMVDGAPTAEKLPAVTTGEEYTNFTWSDDERIPTVLSYLPNQATNRYFLQRDSQRYGPYVSDADSWWRWTYPREDGIWRYVATTDPQKKQWAVYADGVPIEGAQCGRPEYFYDTVKGFDVIYLRPAGDEQEVVHMTVPVPAPTKP